MTGRKSAGARTSLECLDSTFRSVRRLGSLPIADANNEKREGVLMKSRIGSLLCVIIGLCTSSGADVSDVQVVPVDSTSLDGFVSQDIMFTTDEPLLGAAMYFKVLEGSIHDDPLGRDSRPPSSMTIKQNPNLAFDTYFDGPTDAPLLFAGGPIIDGLRIYGAWAALGSEQSGQMRAARITLSEDANQGIGFLRLVTDPDVFSHSDSFFIGARDGEVLLSPFETKSILSGEHVLSGTKALTVISNPGTRVNVPDGALLMHDITSEAPILIENEAVVTFNGGILYNPTSRAHIRIDSMSALFVEDGDVRAGGIELYNGGQFNLTGGKFRVATVASEHGIDVNDGEISVSGGLMSVGTITTDGELTISGGDVTVTSRLELFAGADAKISGGVVDIDRLLSVTDSRLKVTGGEVSAGLLQINGGILSLDGADLIDRTTEVLPKAETSWGLGPEFEQPSTLVDLQRHFQILESLDGSSEPLPHLEEKGTISGVLADGSPFSWDYELYNGGRIELNPEPDMFAMTLSLLLMLHFRNGRRENH